MGGQLSRNVRMVPWTLTGYGVTTKMALAVSEVSMDKNKYLNLRHRCTESLLLSTHSNTEQEFQVTLIVTQLFGFCFQVNFGWVWRRCSLSQNRDHMSCRLNYLTGGARPSQWATPFNWMEKRATMPCMCSRPHPATWRVPWRQAPTASHFLQQTGTRTLRRTPTVLSSYQVAWLSNVQVSTLDRGNYYSNVLN